MLSSTIPDFDIISILEFCVACNELTHHNVSFDNKTLYCDGCGNSNPNERFK